MEKKSIYVGNARQIDLQNATGMSVTINVDEFREAIMQARDGGEAGNAYFKSEKTGREYIKLAVFPLKPENVEQGRRTHSVKLDTWKPEPKPQPLPLPGESNTDLFGDDVAGDDLPF